MSDGDSSVVRVLLGPVASRDAFGDGFKHRAGRLLIRSGDSLRKLCWLVLERDGSVSFGLLDPAVTIDELGRSYVDDSGRVTDEPGGTIVETAGLAARRNPHVTLHRSGTCHIRSRGQEPLVSVRYGTWCPPPEELEWLHVYSDPIEALPIAAKAGDRDAVTVVADPTRSVRIRVDIIPRTGQTFPLLGGSLNTILGLAPEYAARVSLFEHAPVKRRIMIRSYDHSTAG